MSRFVKPTIVRIPISDGDFIDVKKRLTHGEHEDYMSKIMPFIAVKEKDEREKGEVDTTKIESRNVRTAKVVSYLVGWSFTNDDVPVPYSPDMPEAARWSTVESLDHDTFVEVEKAISDHEKSVEQEVAASKNGKAGGHASSPISPSPSSSGGVTSGSTSLTEMSTT